MLPQPESRRTRPCAGHHRRFDGYDFEAAAPPFRLAKFEGDAAFVYAVSEKADGSLLQDAAECAYFAFRKRLRNIKLATTCECSACDKMQTLDLKFVCHHGEFIKHRMGGREELVGRDVILVHRLLKNAVNERLGGRAYALYSDAFVRAAGVDPTAEGLVEHKEPIDVIGDVTCWLRDLEQVWLDENNRQRSEVTSDKAGAVLGFEIAAPRPIVWEYFNMPEHRPKWRGADEVRETKLGARRGAGTVNHCMHGDQVFIEEVIDWRPLDYLTLTTLLPMPGAPKVLMTYAFFETEAAGTRIEIRVAKPKAKDQAFFEQIAPHFAKTISSEVAALKQMLEAREPPPGLSEEPNLAELTNRFVTQPIRV